MSVARGQGRFQGTMSGRRGYPTYYMIHMMKQDRQMPAKTLPFHKFVNNIDGVMKYFNFGLQKYLLSNNSTRIKQPDSS